MTSMEIDTTNTNKNGRSSFTSSVGVGLKRKPEQFVDPTLFASPPQPIPTNAPYSSSASSSSSSSSLLFDPSSLLTISCLTPSERSSVTVDRVCLRSSIEVNQMGDSFVHLQIFTPTPASRAKAKEEKYQAQKAAMAAKKQKQKQKQKEARADARQAREELVKKLTEEGKTKDEIAAILRQQREELAAANGGTLPYQYKRSNRESQETKRRLLADMRQHRLQRIVVDCSFDHLMRLEEICSLAKQLRFMYGHNVRAEKPAHLILTSLGMSQNETKAPSTSSLAMEDTEMATASPPSTAAASFATPVDHFNDLRLDTDERRQMKQSFAASTSIAESLPTSVVPSSSSSSSTSALPIPTPSPLCATTTRSIFERVDGFERLPLDRTTHHYSECFDKDDIIYLTAESSEVIYTLDPSKVYIIGGIVDHNRMKGHCHELATQAGIRTARLPIQEYLINDKRTVITVNQVFEILLKAQQHQQQPTQPASDSSTSVDWPTILKEVLPSRSQWKERETTKGATGDSKPGGLKEADENDADVDDAENDRRMDEADQGIEDDVEMK